MRIGTTPTHTFELPFEGELVKKYEIIYSQRGEVLVCKTESDGKLEGNVITVQLSQEDTLKFDPNTLIDIQTKILTVDDKVITSDIYSDMPYRCLKPEVLV